MLPALDVKDLYFQGGNAGGNGSTCSIWEDAVFAFKLSFTTYDSTLSTTWYQVLVSLVYSAISNFCIWYCLILHDDVNYLTVISVPSEAALVSTTLI